MRLSRLVALVALVLAAASCAERRAGAAPGRPRACPRPPAALRERRLAAPPPLPRHAGPLRQRRHANDDAGQPACHDPSNAEPLPRRRHRGPPPAHRLPARTSASAPLWVTPLSGAGAAAQRRLRLPRLLGRRGADPDDGAMEPKLGTLADVDGPRGGPPRRGDALRPRHGRQPPRARRAHRHAEARLLPRREHVRQRSETPSFTARFTACPTTRRKTPPSRST